MNSGRLNGLLFFVIVLILAAACAKISAPTGGLRDKQPPVVVESVPVNRAVNFNGKKVEITFDEFVTLDNINEKFMASPPMKKKPRVFMKGKSVIVEFEEKLKENTTYTFYFLDAIKDLNEGNILNNFQFVFSTGSVIDSLSVTGHVYNADDLELPEKTQVIMYGSLADTSVIRQLPDYISRVDAYGYFRIDNVKEGQYRLYAIKDDDNSKNYNRTEEEFAFLDSTIFVSSEKSYIPVVKDTIVKKPVTSPVKSTTTAKAPPADAPPPAPVLKSEYQLLLFLAKKSDHYLSGSSRDTKYLLSYIFSLPPDTMKIDFSIPEFSSDKYFLQESRRKDTLKVWLTDSTLYSQALVTTILKYPFTDTLGVLDYKVDTVPMRFVTPRATRGTKSAVPSLKVESNLVGGGIKPGLKVIFKTEAPFIQPDTSLIRLYEIADSIKKRIPYNFVLDTNNPARLVFNAKLEQKKKYQFIADSAAFGNILNERSDSIGINFTVRDPESYSKMTLNIKNCQGPAIIELMGNTENLLAREKIAKDGKVEFPLLEKGFYRIRAIYDLNGDGEWTTGDFMTGRQPEPVSYYKSEIEIKVGWDVVQDWDLKERNYKDEKLRAKPKIK
ncbi:MAG: Ig-like domain-containing protein [Bacteroidales bacterium]|nr:Ig-like domain-containing protein [Bacteroidales bacterium]